jgi:tetratricopeptide (TPR) repeat protein
MLTDRYGLASSTASAAARDDYAYASDQALTFYPGAAEAYDRAIAADPGFALAHAGKAQVLMRQGDIAGARAALDAAKDVSAGLPHREASHIGFFDLVFAGRTEAAIAALYAHLTAWPRDALVVASAANPNGLIGASGRIGQKHQIAMLMNSLAPHYGDDFWFLSYHAMALCEDGQLAAARMKIEKSVTTNPNNAHGAHGFAHVCYESGEPETARTYLSSWLATYPRRLFLRSSKLAPVALRNPGRQLGRSAATVPGRDCARPAQRRAATENLRWSGVFMAHRARGSAARHHGLARAVCLCEQRIATAGQWAR